MLADKLIAIAERYLSSDPHYKLAQLARDTALDNSALCAALWRYVSGDSCDCKPDFICRYCEGRQAMPTEAHAALDTMCGRGQVQGRIDALEKERDDLRAALLPYAEQNYSDMDNLLRARKLCGLPDFPPITQAMDEMRELYGKYFDGVDAVAFVAEMRDDEDADDDL